MGTLTPEQISSESVSHDEQPYVNRLRRFLQDTVELNKLEGVRESSDTDLLYALQDTVDEINYETSVITSYTTFGEIPWNILKLGAVLQILTSKGILSARNTLTYNDAGGVTVQDYDKYGRYTNYFNLLISKYSRGVQNWKVALNIDSCYGGLGSDYLINNNNW